MNRAIMPFQDSSAAPPAGPMTQIGQFARPYTLPVKALLGTRYYVFRARPFERKSREAIADYQLKRLQDVVRVAAERVPFYRRRFHEAGFEPGDLKSLDDLKRLPILRRRDLKQHFDDLYDHTRAREAVLMQTSGTTGQPVQFLIPREQTVIELAYHWRFWLWAGYRPGSRVAAFRHYTPKEGEPICRYERSSNTLFFSVHDMYESRLGEYVEAFNRFRPALVRGYPSSVYILAKAAQERGLSLYRPRAVLTASETLLPQYRQTIERAMGAPVFDWYGTNERILTAYQCEYRHEYHMSAEAGIAEFLDLDHDAGSASTAQSLVLTSLVNTIMPFIRYEVGDLAVAGTGPCPCGRGLPTINRILGRTDDVLITHEGKSITPVRFYTVFEKFMQVDQFQVVQVRPDYIKVDIVTGEGFDRGVHKQLAVELARVVGGVALEIKHVTQIDTTAAGKRRNVIRHVGDRQT
ncbi:MAG: phenylacetate--CoA ligase family protein [Gammaproteobacteria bacterium]